MVLQSNHMNLECIVSEKQGKDYFVLYDRKRRPNPVRHIFVHNPRWFCIRCGKEHHKPSAVRLGIQFSLVAEFKQKPFSLARLLGNNDDHDIIVIVERPIRRKVDQRWESALERVEIQLFPALKVD